MLNADLDILRDTAEGGEVSPSDVLTHLREVVAGYLSQHESLSVNALSKRCGVSEATMRRIHSGKIKTLPNLTNILKVLSYISKKQKITEIAEAFPGPLSLFLSLEANPVVENFVFEDAVDLSAKLDTPMKYIVYKAASNHKGVTRDQVQELTGLIGLDSFNELLERGLLVEKDGVYFAKYNNYKLSNDTFVSQFKATASFIKPDKLTNAPRKYSQMFYNCSESVDLKTYAEILRVNRAALKKIKTLMFAPENAGDIPAFLIGAIDTLDNKSAYEITSEKL